MLAMPHQNPFKTSFGFELIDTIHTEKAKMEPGTGTQLAVQSPVCSKTDVKRHVRALPQIGKAEENYGGYGRSLNELPLIKKLSK